MRSERVLFYFNPGLKLSNLGDLGFCGDAVDFTDSFFGLGSFYELLICFLSQSCGFSSSPCDFNLRTAIASLAIVDCLLNLEVVACMRKLFVLSASYYLKSGSTDTSRSSLSFAPYLDETYYI